MVKKANGIPLDPRQLFCSADCNLGLRQARQALRSPSRVQDWVGMNERINEILQKENREMWVSGHTWPREKVRMKLRLWRMRLPLRLLLGSAERLAQDCGSFWVQGLLEQRIRCESSLRFSTTSISWFGATDTSEFSIDMVQRFGTYGSLLNCSHYFF